MAPTRPKKRKSTESTSSMDIQGFPAPPLLVPTKTRIPARTPTRSPIKKAKMGLTLVQKQKLIDNLQNEITERARALRGQYTSLALALREKVERRVTRIPPRLRQANIGELILKYNSTTAPSSAVAGSVQKKAPSPAKNILHAGPSTSRASPSPQRSGKRQSDEVSSMDKENEDIENPKKRARGAPQPPARTTSRAKLQPSQVLSPRSANSHTLPRSPVRSASPGKSKLARPISPLKPTAPTTVGEAASILTNMVERAKSTRATAGRKATTESNTSASSGAGRGKRAAAPAAAPRVGRGRASTISDVSDASSGTTVVKKASPAKTAKKAPAKKTMMSTIKGMGETTKKAPAAKAPAAPPAARRVLRKRN